MILTLKNKKSEKKYSFLVEALQFHNKKFRCSSNKHNQTHSKYMNNNKVLNKIQIEVLE